MGVDRIDKKSKSTEKVSPKILDKVKENLEGLQNGTVLIFVKNGYILGVERRQREHFPG